MLKQDILNSAKNLLTEYWNGELPVNINKLVEALNITIKKDMLFDSSGIVTVSENSVSCRINVMDKEEKHRFSIACAVAYAELNSEAGLDQDFSFDVVKDYDKNANEDNKVWQAVKLAQYILMPEEEVKKQVEIGIKQGITPSFSCLYYSKEFKVPEEVVKERFEELGIK